MKRSFGLDVLSCRRCKGRMRLIAVVLDRTEVRRLHAHLVFSLPIHLAGAPPAYAEALDFP